MQQLEFKYKTEVGKNGSLLRMNSSLMNKNDALNRCIYSIHVLFYPAERLHSPEHEFEQDELEYLLELVRKYKEDNQSSECLNCEELEDEIERIRRNGTGENEERWKTLYNKESQQTYRLSKLNAELMDTVKQFTASRNKNQEELRIFLADYLEIYKKVHIQNIDNQEQGVGVQETIRETSTTKKKERSNSIKKSRKGQEKKQKHDKEKTVLFQESKQTRQSKVCKQWDMLNKLRQSATQQTEVVRKELVEILKSLKLSEDNTRYLRAALRQSIRDSL